MGVGATCGALLEVLGRLIECGTLGSGYVVKLVTNQIWFINAAAVGETLVLGKKAGVELPVLSEALKNSVADTFVIRHDVPSIFAGHYDPSFTLNLSRKDLDLIAAMSEATQTAMPMTQQAQHRFEAARSAFGGDQPEPLVCKLIEDASGVDLRVERDWPDHSEA